MNARHDLVGTWKLVSAWTQLSGGERIFDYGERPAGYLIYTADGHIIGTISHGSRKPLSGDLFSTPVAERADAFSSFVAYAGLWTVDGERVVHHVEVSSIQNWVNTKQVRDFEIEGDRLTLTARVALGGETRVVQLTWTRAHSS